jgi:hypothetical protein
MSIWPMRRWVAVALSGFLLVSAPAFAARTQAQNSQGVLSPGGAAGVERAQDFNVPMILSVVGVTAVGVAVAIMISHSGSHHATTTTTGGSSK